MLKRITNAFADADVTLKEKARILAIMNIVLMIMLTLGTVTNGLEGKVAMTLLGLLFVAALGTSLFLLTRGNFSVPAYLTMVVLLIAVYTMNFMGMRETPFTIWKLVSYNVGALLICALFVNSTLQLTFISVGGVVFFVMAVVMKYNQPDVDTGLVFFVTLYSGVILVAGNFLVHHTSRTFKRHLSAARESRENVERNLVLLKELVDSSSEGLSVGEDLVSATNMTLDQARDAKAKLDNLMDEIKSLENQVDRSNESYARIEKAEEGVRNTMESQTAAVNESSASVEESAALIQSISSSAREKGEMLTQLVKASAEGSDQLEDALAAFREVSRSSQEIIDVITVIEDIADRTNMLAMNAAIEAAHASDSGRGFAVVAEEIRKLAEETNVNSRQVREILENNHEQIQKSVRLSEGTGQMFSDIHGRIEEVDRAIDEILKGLEELSGGTTEITTSVAHLRTTNNDVNEALGEMREMTEFGKDSVKEIVEGSRRMDERIQNLHEATARITEYTKRISSIGDENKDNIADLQERMKSMENS